MSASADSARGWPGRLLRPFLAVAGILVLLAGAALAAFRVAADRRESRARAEIAPVAGRFVRSAGLEIFFQEAGPPDGPAVVLVHGTGAWSGIWQETMQILTESGFHTIAIDLPPFGFSERPVPAEYGTEAQASRIIGVLDSLGLARVTLVGHSFGARPTVEAALRDPGRVRALVLVDAALGIHGPAAAGDASLPLRALLSTELVRDVLVSATLTNPLLTRRLLRLLILDPADATDRQVHMVQRQFPVRGTTHAVGEWLRQFLLGRERVMSGDRAQYRRLGMPALVIWGEEDRITPLAQGRDLLTVLPAAELVVLQHTGHIPLIEDPPAFDHALRTFLRRHVAAP
jgi:pimeloyl-ACP methyl ester carboxylesterase